MKERCTEMRVHWAKAQNDTMSTAVAMPTLTSGAAKETAAIGSALEYESS